jgi:hypothetical protein
MLLGKEISGKRDSAKQSSLADFLLYSYHIGMSIGSVRNAFNALLLGLPG